MSDSQNTLHPADIFQEGIEYLYQYFQPLGYKLLKSNAIKKRKGQLSYEISFFSSHYNYIDYANHRGSVILDVRCTVWLKKEIGFAFRFSGPKVQNRRFELLSEDLKVNKPLLDEIWLAIEKRFLSVINGLEENPNEQMRAIGLLPEVHAEDYSWFYWLKRPLVELLGDENTLAQYDENSITFDLPENKAQRMMKEYIYLVKTSYHIDVEPHYTAQHLYDLSDRIYRALSEANIEGWVWKEDYNIIQNMPSDDLADLAIAVSSLGSNIRSELNKNSERMRQEEPELARELDELHNIIQEKKLNNRRFFV